MEPKGSRNIHGNVEAIGDFNNEGVGTREESLRSGRWGGTEVPT